MIRTSAPAVCLAVALAFALAGCGRKTGVKAPVALSSALASGGALNAGGEGPLWALQIRSRQLSFSSERVAAVVIANAGPAISDRTATWTGDAIGRSFRATVTAVECHDAATGLVYPMAAEVQAGGLAYRGCATQAGQGLGPRG